MPLTLSTYKVCTKLKEEGLECPSLSMPYWHTNEETCLPINVDIQKLPHLEEETYLLRIDHNKNHPSLQSQLLLQSHEKKTAHETKSTRMQSAITTFVNVNSTHKDFKSKNERTWVCCSHETWNLTSLTISYDRCGIYEFWVLKLSAYYNISQSWKLRSGVDDMHCSLTLDLLQVPAFFALEIWTPSTYLMITFRGIFIQSTWKLHFSTQSNEIRVICFVRILYWSLFVFFFCIFVM